MSDDNFPLGENSDELKHVEHALRNLAPAPPQIDRDRLMFLAGQASAEGSGFRVQESENTGRDFVVSTQYSAPTTRCSAPTSERQTTTLKSSHTWFWPASTATLAATSLALAFTLVFRPDPQPTVVYRDRPAAALAAASRDSSSRADRAPATVAVAMAPQPAAVLVPHGNYLRTREVALRMGLDAIGSPAAVGGRSSFPATYRELLEGLAGAGRPPNPSQRLENSSNM